MIIFGLSIVSPTMAFSTGSSVLKGELYSESTYIPEYGVLNENYLRLFISTSEKLNTYLGISSQSQIKTSSTQSDLYEKDRLMPLVGVRGKIWGQLHYLAELRTQDRSRLGLFAGNIWEYSAAELPLFTEYYAEAISLPSFTNAPVMAGWLKQGLRFHPNSHLYVDPYVEAYLRQSPDPDLGRDTQQLRLGLRLLYSVSSWNISLLTYHSFEQHENDHLETLLVLGGSF